MAIKVTNQTMDGSIDGEFAVRADLIADTSAEVIAIGNDATSVQGSDAAKLAWGSTCLTCDGKFGMLGSDSVWKFN